MKLPEIMPADKMKIYLKRKNKNYFKKGFSIGEVILAAFILSFVLVTIVSVFSSGMRNSMDSRDAIIASELSQEGVELVRNIRDNNWANNRASFDPIYIPTGNNCRVDKNSTSVVCDGAYALKLDGNNFFVNNGSTTTKFKRRIILNYDAAAGEMSVISLVSWNSSSPPLTIVECTTGSKCVYSQLVLDKWGGT